MIHQSTMSAKMLITFQWNDEFHSNITEAAQYAAKMMADDINTHTIDNGILLIKAEVEETDFPKN